MTTISTEDLNRETGALYLRIASAFRRAKTEGRFQDGDKLPPIRELAYQLSTTPNTIARAYRVLIADGDAEARVGDGTYFVAKRPRPNDEIMREKVLTGLSMDNDQIINMRSANTCFLGTENDVNDALQNIMSENSFHADSYSHEAYRRMVIEEIIKHDAPKYEFGGITLCHGAVNAMFMALSALSLSSSKSTVLVENFCYTGFRSSKSVSRLNSVNLPMDNEGVLPEAIEHACQSGDVLAFMTSSVTQNPTTITTSQTRRAEIAALARKYDFHILDDIVYARFATKTDLGNSYEAFCPERLWQIDSVSKLGFSNLRIGWVISPHGHHNVENLLHSTSVNLSDLNVLILFHLFKSGAIARTETAFIKHMAQIYDITYPALSPWTSYLSPRSPFAWLPLPKGQNAVGFAEALERYHIKISPGILFASTDSPPAVSHQFARITFSHIESEDTLRFALDKITEILANPSMSQMMNHA